VQSYWEFTVLDGISINMENDINNIVDRCWSTIGVWGRQAPRCEKLNEVIHCRNCRKYWDAGRQVLEKGIPDGYLEQWTRTLASYPEQHLITDRSDIYFRLENKWFSLPTKYFVEVSTVKYIHVLPHNKSELMLGLVNFGGTIQLCFSLSHLLNITPSAGPLEIKKETAYKRLILVKINNKEYVFQVDEIGGVFRYAQNDINLITDSVSEVNKLYLSGSLQIDSKTVSCIDALQLAQGFEGFSGEQ